jgi:hypothetical protein
VRLHVVYRSTSKENRKPRPAYYSKRDCLLSLLRARAACPEAGALVFVNDGELPEDRLGPMRSHGEVLAFPDLDMRRSYLGALDQVDRHGWADDDLVFLVEDDYLHREHALNELVAAARAIPGAHYFGTYGNVVGGPLQPDMRRPHGTPAGPDVVVGETRWRRGLSTTFTYGARIGALRRDMRMHRITPSLGGAFDHALPLAFQGWLPYRPRDLAEVLREDHTWSRRAKLLTWRCVLTGAALAQRLRTPHVLVVAEPQLSSHLEEGFIAPGDWAAESAAASEWGRSQAG